MKSTREGEEVVVRLPDEGKLKAVAMPILIL
jgi:hypothetical protein